MTLVWHISQLQYSYGPAVINDPTPGMLFNGGILRKHRLAKNFQAYEPLKDKLVPWYPSFGMEMVSVDGTLSQKCRRQFFARRYDVLGI